MQGTEDGAGQNGRYCLQTVHVHDLEVTSVLPYSVPKSTTDCLVGHQDKEFAYT